MKVIVDTDPGIDDAVALGILLSRKDIELLAITCVHGNVGVEQCTSNALKILEAFDRTDVPVFKGAEKPLLGLYCFFTVFLFLFYRPFPFLTDGRAISI